MNSLLLIIFILILIDVFLSIEFPTHVAYILLTLLIVNEIDNTLLFKILLGVLLWFALVVFHYTIWRKMIERIHDRIVAPRKHIGGIEALIGKKGIIKEIEGTKFIFINEELYEFESNKEILLEKEYRILAIQSNKLII